MINSITEGSYTKRDVDLVEVDRYFLAYWEGPPDFTGKGGIDKTVVHTGQLMCT